MSTRLDGKTAIVTGAARGVARGVAGAFLKAGASVMIVDREGDLGRSAVQELGTFGDVEFLEFDLANRAALPEIVRATIDRFGQIDTLVNAAQASRQMLLVDHTVEAASIAFDTGFWPTFILMQAAFAHLVKARGSVINFGSGAALSGMPTQASYAAAKEAIRALSKVAATEWGEHGVRVNVLCPFALSPGVEQWREHFPEAYAAQISKVPLRRIGDPEADIGAAAVFLASDAAGYITGQTLMVDGGQTKVF